MPDLITVLGLAAVIAPILAFHSGEAPQHAMSALPPHLAAEAELREADPEDLPEPGELSIPGAYAAAHAGQTAGPESAGVDR